MCEMHASKRKIIGMIVYILIGFLLILHIDMRKNWDNHSFRGYSIISVEFHLTESKERAYSLLQV